MAFASRSLPRRRAGAAGGEGSRAYDPGVRIGTLGWVRVEKADGTEVALPGVLESRVLGALAVRAGEVVSVDALVDAVFGADAASNASTRLQHHISRLRKRVGSEVVVTVGSGYRLDIGTVEVDWVRFEALVTDGARLAVSDPAASLVRLAAALELWRGEPFVELEEWLPAQTLSVRLHELRRVALEEHAGALVAVGELGDAVGLLEALTTEDPLRERRWALLMTALYRAGRPAEALRAFERSRAILVEETGLSPSRGLDELAHRILTQDPDLAGAGPPSATSVVSGHRPSGTVTFLFTDIEGSTRLWETSPDAMRLAVAWHDEIVRVAIEVHDGVVFSTSGDGLAAAFQRAGLAVSAAVAAQRALAAAAWPSPLVLRVRMGMHTGEADERDGDYFGPPVNRAARLMACAPGGQVLVSDATAAIMGRVPDVELVELGWRRLRGVVDPMRVFGVRAKGLATPERATSDETLANGNLPPSLTEWFGPIGAVQDLATELAAHRFVTLTGTGGVGKTRMAIEAASLATTEFVDGVWFVELAPTDSSAVSATMMTTMGIRPQPSIGRLDSVIDWLRGRRLLLILDNCEHVINSAAELIAKVLTGAPTVTVLATSREPLGVRGERVVPIPSMAVGDAAALFVDRAVRTDTSMTFTVQDLEVVRNVCERLDRIPLAIELAAARARSLSPTELLARLDDRFRLLRSSQRDGPAHHRTLHETVAWSHQLLTQPQQLLFARCSVFTGGFELAAGQAVCCDEQLDDFDVVDGLASLVDKSMMQVERLDTGTRYRLLETLRQYGQERLGEQNEMATFRDRHLAYYVTIASGNEHEFRGPGQREAAVWFQREWDNVRVARGWAITSGDAEQAAALVVSTFEFAFFWLRVEHVEWATASVENGLGDGMVARRWAHAAAWQAFVGEADVAIRQAQEGLATDTGADPHTATWCWFALAAGLFNSGAAAESLEAARRSVQCGEGNAYLESQALSMAAWSASVAEPTAVAAIAARHRELAEGSHVPTSHCQAWNSSGLAALVTGAANDALAAFHESLRRCQGIPLLEGVTLQAIVLTLSTSNEPGTATALHDALSRIYELRFWGAIWNIIEVAASHFITIGHPDVGAILVGYTDAHCPTGALVTQMHAESLGALTLHLEAAHWLSCGAEMDRDGIVSYTLDRLADLA